MSVEFEKAWEDRKSIAQAWKNNGGKVVGDVQFIDPRRVDLCRRYPADRNYQPR